MAVDPEEELPEIESPPEGWIAKKMGDLAEVGFCRADDGDSFGHVPPWPSHPSAVRNLVARVRSATGRTDELHLGGN